MQKEDLFELEDIGAIVVTTDIPAEIEYKDYAFEIDKDYKVTIIGELKGTKPTATINVLTTEEGVDKVELQVVASTTEGEIEDIEAINEAILKTENSKADKIFEVTKNGEYSFKITGTNGRRLIVKIKVSNIINEMEAISILEGISRITDSGLQKMSIIELENVEDKEIIYSLDVIVHKGDLVLDGESEVEGATLNTASKLYEFGKEKDVATGSNYAQNTVVLKVEGNLTINQEVTVTSVKSSGGYGGPKGMIIYCTGTLTNNGIISMTARGAKAEGQNVYLWKNGNATYEYVPAVGASGGPGRTGDYRMFVTGATGGSGASKATRATGGGGSGGYWSMSSSNYRSGDGGRGTSYSGGPGSGGVGDNSYGKNSSPSANGGAGGRGFQPLSYWAGAGGGAGNPGGYGEPSQHYGANYGGNGTGGLLVVYTNEFVNKGAITSNGSNGGNAGGIGGGGSGGGSINIFYTSSYLETENSSIKALGGGAGISSGNGNGNANGGAGGTGTITKGKIENGTFEKQ